MWNPDGILESVTDPQYERNGCLEWSAACNGSEGIRLETNNCMENCIVLEPATDPQSERNGCFEWPTACIGNNGIRLETNIGCENLTESWNP